MLAVLSVGAATVIILDPFGTHPADAVDATGSEATTEAEPEIEYTDLTEGLDPFEPPAEGYYAVTWHDLVWIPNTLDADWDVFYQDATRSVDWSRYVADDDRALLTCSDIRNKTEFYPTDPGFAEPEAWYQAELDRDAKFVSEGDEVELVNGPTYTHYRIDGQAALLVEYERHWTAYEDSEGAVSEVDWNMSTAYLYINLPGSAGTASDPVHPARCDLMSVSPASTDDDPAYEAALDVLLDIRLWLD